MSAIYRLCVHVRRGDFVKSRLHEHPREDFTAAAIKYVIEKNVPDRSTPSSVIMIGNDHDWSHSLLETINITSLKYVTETKPEDGHVDLAFATLFCDSVLLPASASSFGWWMAYISRPGTIVYYNAKYSKPDGIEKEFEPKDFFLPEWIALRYDNMTNAISEIKW